MSTQQETNTIASPHAAAAAGQTLGAMILGSASRHSDDPALRWKDGGAWQSLSYSDLAAAVREIAGGLIALGIREGDRVAILSDTRPEWTLADAGALCAGAVVVPVYQTNSPEECRYVLRHSGARAVFCENRQQLEKIDRVRGDLPELEHVILMSGDATGAVSIAALRGSGVALAPAVDARVAAARPDDLATIVYSSGTTGPPKGCMLTHANWTSTVDMYVDRLEIRTGVVFIFLPLAHVMGRITQMFALAIGGTIVYWQRDMKTVLDDLKEAQPTHFASVPRMFEKIYTAASVGIAQESRVRRAVFAWSLATGRKVRSRERAGARVGPLLRARHRLAQRLVLSKIQALFGGRMEFAFTAAAPIAADVLEFFDAASVRVLEAWGMTETTAGGTINTPREWRIGTVGKPLPPAEVEIAADGEVLMRGPHIFEGYLKNPDATAETIVDGWIHTGDLGSIDDDGYVSITGRKKDIIITSSGKNITPTNIENVLKESRWISEAVVYGDRRPYLVALIALDPDELAALTEEGGEDGIDAVIGREIYHVNQHFARVEQVKKFRILDGGLSQAAGELTPTMKVKRNVVYKKYAGEIDELYEDMSDAAQSGRGAEL